MIPRSFQAALIGALLALGGCVVAEPAGYYPSYDYGYPAYGYGYPSYRYGYPWYFGPEIGIGIGVGRGWHGHRH